MNIKKSLLIAGTATTIGLAGIVGAVSAQGTNSNTGTSLVDKIAQKFNLNKDDVQKVFDEDRATHEAEHQQKVEDKLSQLVKDGKLTEDQKQKILAKQSELKSQMETERGTMKDKTPAERKALMDQRRTELEDWAKQNNIPTEYLHFVAGHGHGKGPGRPHNDDAKPADQ